MEIVCGVYKITSPSGKIYIGESKNIHRRTSSYKKLRKDCKNQTKLYNSLYKHGWEAHTFEIIEKCNFDDLKCRERYWQDFYDVLDKEKGLNLKLTNCNEVKSEWSEESKNKIRGENNHNFGRLYTQEEKTSRSEALKGTRNGEKHPQWGMRGELSHLYNKIGELHPCHGRKQTEQEKKKRIKSREDNSINNSQIIILDLEIGVFYYRIEESAKALEISYNKMSKMLRNEQKNKTNLVYV